MKGELVRQEIERTLGFFPPFFEPALSTPDVLETFWKQTRSTYFENPIPARLKTRISTRLSRYCAVPYCLACHSCELHALGVTSGKILDLLEAPFEVARPLRILRDQKRPLQDWPDEASPLHAAIIAASECVYLRCPEAASCQAEIRRIMGEEAHGRWVALLVFVEASHRWMEAHPEIRHEEDMRSKGHFASMLNEEPALDDFFAHYSKRIEREHTRQKRSESVEEVRRVLEGTSRPPPNRKFKSLFRTWAKIAALTVAVMGIVSFVGCFLPWPLLTSWIPNATATKANVAFTFALAGIGLWIWTGKPLNAHLRIAAKALGWLVCAIGGASLFEDISGIDLGIDQLLMQQNTGFSITAPGRMSPYTAIVLMFLGLALALMGRISYRKNRPSEYLAIGGGICGFITLLGYAYGVNVSLGPERIHQMSLPTAILSLLLASGIICARPTGNVISVLVSGTTAGHQIRQLLLLLGIAPAVIGWIGLLGRWRGWYSMGFGFALVVTSSTLLFCTVALMLGRTIIQAELQRRKAERLLLDREFDFRATFDHAAVGVAHMSLDGRWIRVNDKLCQMVGYSREELLEKSFQDISVPEEMKNLHSLRRRLINGETPQFSLEKRYLRKNGSIFWGNLTQTMLRDSSGKSRYTISLIEDISERKRHEEEIANQKALLEEAVKAKDHVLSVISHELRTPLTPVMAALSSSVSEATSVDQRNTLEMMRRNIEHEVRLIDDLLDVTRISKDKLRLNLAPVDLHALIEEVFTGVQSGLDAKGIRLRLVLNATKHVINGDPARVRQTLLNLFDNAKKFTPKDGEITVATTSRGDRIITQFIDTGIGISPENLHRIFEAFEQGDQSTQRHHGGLGLGLAIVQGLVEAHGGTLSVESPGLERGSTFTFELPTTDESVKKSEPQQEVEIAQARILLVDDHDDTRRTLQRLLERRGHRVRTASSVADAIAAAGQEDFDLLISDIGLPDGSGLDLLKLLTASVGHPVAGIALSGFGTEEDVELSTRAGFVCHLIKPIDMQALEGAIAKAMQHG